MYSNVGSKIKALAVFIAIVGALTSIYVGIRLYGLQNPIALIFIIGGPILSWISSLTLYGFGELIENTQTIREDIQIRNRKKPRPYAQPPWTCSVCGQVNDGGQSCCSQCGKY